MKRILAINPGSTSTKISVYDDRKLVFSHTIDHLVEDLDKFARVQDQFEFRKNVVLKLLNDNDIKLDSFQAIVGRGGLLPPVKSGAYRVNELMVDRLKNRPVVEHASNLGALISFEIAKSQGIDAYIYDSVAVDELNDIARITGVPAAPRKSLTHALNSRAMAHKLAENLGKKYEDLNIIVAHLGGGISITAHGNGEMIDIVSDDEGPFSPERSGRISCKDIISLCFNDTYDKNTIKKMIRGKGGLYAHLGTVDAREIEKLIEQGDENAKLVYNAMAYQISKSIAELSIVFRGKVDAIVLTGGIAYSKMITDWIIDRVSFLAPVKVLPGENELESLTYGVLRVLNGEEDAREYTE